MPALYVIRHGHAENQGLLTGQTDPDLDVQGRLQALRLRGLQGAVYCSPLRRALHTALFIGPEAIILTGLAEISYGEWDGLSWADIERRWPRIARAKLASWQTVTPPGGEPWRDFTVRVSDALATVLHGPLPAVIVAHEAVNAIIANRFSGIRIEDYKQNHCEIRSYDIRPQSEPREPCPAPDRFSNKAGGEPGPA